MLSRQIHWALTSTSSLTSCASKAILDSTRVGDCSLSLNLANG
jgi:hypothetical protein